MAEIILRQLRYFVMLFRLLQYRRAAQQLGISQPSRSLQISALEEAVGAPLLERKRNGLILTQAPVGHEEVRFIRDPRSSAPTATFAPSP